MPPNQLGYGIILLFITTFAVLCSTYLLMTMTFERLCSIIWPLKAASFSMVKRTRIIIACVFVTCFSYSIPFLFITGNRGKICIPNKFASVTVLGEVYYWLTQIFMFIIPFSSLLTMNSIIIHTLRKRSRLNISGQGQNEGQTLKIKHSEKQIFTMLLLVTFTYLILSFSMRVLNFYHNFYTGSTPSYYAGFHLIYQIGVQSFYTNHAINFFFYVLSGRKFKTDLMNLLISRKSNKNEITTVSKDNWDYPMFWRRLSYHLYNGMYLLQRIHLLMSTRHRTLLKEI